MKQHRINLNNIYNNDSLDLMWNRQFINKFDCICSNPPFGSSSTDINIMSDDYWAPFNSNNNHLNIIPREKSVQFILHTYNSLKNGGRCGIVVPRCVLYNGSNSIQSSESKFRKFLLTNTNLYKIVLLEIYFL